MSLTVSTSIQSVSLVANIRPLQLLSVADVSANLNGKFWDLTDISTQRNTLHSACHYLEALEDKNPILKGIREEMLPELGTKSEPTATDCWKLSSLITSWSLNRRAIQDKFSEPAVEAPVPTTPKPPPPLPPASTRIGNPLFDESPAESLWRDFSKETLLGLKQASLSESGPIRIYLLDDTIHAEFLLSAAHSWLKQAKEALMEESKAKRDRISGTVIHRVMDYFSMSAEVLEHFRKEEKRTSPLAQVFWKSVCERSDFRQMLSRLMMRDLQLLLDDGAKVQLDRIAGHLERGIVESMIMPHFEGQLSPSPLDDTQGTAAALEISKHLDVLPRRALFDLNAEQSAALHAIERVLKTAAQKMRGDAQSSYTSSFVRTLGVDVTRLPSLVEMINVKKEK